MTTFGYRNGELHAEDVPLTQIAATYDTPTYIYSRAAIESNYLQYQSALEDCAHLICYAVKANSNLAVLNLLANLGSGFDIVSQGELERVLAAGGDPSKVVFSGVAKNPAAMRRALEVHIRCFNVESRAELELLNQVAGEMNVKAPVSLRVNPDIDAGTHPYISTGMRDNKFGIAHADAVDVYMQASRLAHLSIVGLDCHIGSQLTEISPFVDALHRLLGLVDELSERGITLNHLDLGGGLGVRYRDENPPAISDYIAALRSELTGRDLTLMFEPGRSIVANAGLLLTRVEYLKNQSGKDFAIVDAAMNDMIRPALYDAWLDVHPVSKHSTAESRCYDVVGPVCESSDFLARERDLALAGGDLLALFGAGAYGFTMSSNYNTRPRAAELMVDGQGVQVVRERESITDLYATESTLAQCS